MKSKYLFNADFLMFASFIILAKVMIVVFLKATILTSHEPTPEPPIINHVEARYRGITENCGHTYSLHYYEVESGKLCTFYQKPDIIILIPN